jgi:acyl-CoA thioester hydrolase
MKSIFILKRIVESSEIDTLNHVNNVVYVKWMEQVAVEHWAELTKENPLPNYIWVVTRHEIDYLKQALLGDEITIKTWVGTTHGFKSERHIEFYKKDTLLVKVKTVWAMLDAKTFKPTRITENVLKVLQA